MFEDLIVVDDFFEKPDEIRKFALSQPFVSHSQSPYAGEQTARGYYGTAIKKRFEDLINGRLEFDADKDVFGSFRISCEGQQGTTKVHFDSTQWAGLIYLSLPQTEVDGTLFYRHRETSSIGPEVSFGSRDWARHRVEIVEKIIKPHSMQTDAWEVIYRVPLQYNRLLLFQGWKYFHSAGPSFGQDFQNARLTQNFFFNSRTI